MIVWQLQINDDMTKKKLNGKVCRWKKNNYL